MVRNLFLFFTSVLFSLRTLAGAKDGVLFDGALGLPAITISNPNGENAGYEGISLQGRLFAPIYSDGAFHTQLHGVLRYHDLENKYSSDGQTEVANHIGPGVGLSIRLGRLTLGGEYSLMKARHYYIGHIGLKTEYDYAVGTAFAGFVVPFGDLSVGLGYNYSVGKIKKDETGLSKDSDYAEQSIWFHMTYNTGASVGDFARKLVRP